MHLVDLTFKQVNATVDLHSTDVTRTEYRNYIYSGIFRGALVRGPPFGRTAVIFVNYFGIIFSAV